MLVFNYFGSVKDNHMGVYFCNVLKSYDNTRLWIPRTKAVRAMVIHVLTGSIGLQIPTIGEVVLQTQRVYVLPMYIMYILPHYFSMHLVFFF